MSQAGLIDIENANPQIPTHFDGDTGTGAIPIANVLEIVGGAGVTTDASGNTVLISLTGGGAGIDQILTDSGAPAVEPDITGLVNLIGGEGIDVTGTGPGNTVTIVGEDASTINKGIASFDGTDFTIIAGHVSLAGAGAGQTITGNDATALTPSGGNWNIVGTGSLTTSGSGSTLTTALTGLTNHAVLVGAGTSTITKLAVGSNGQVLVGSTGADPVFATVGTNANMNTTTGAGTLTLNPYNCAKWIVDPTANIGTHQTIAAALTAASSGDTIFIRPGSFTENLTLKAGVNLVAFNGDESTPNVTIIGKATFTAAGKVSISNIRLQTNSDFFLAVTGTAASSVVLTNCYLNCTNNTGISFTSSDASAMIQINYSLGNLGTTGIGLYSSSSAGTINIDWSSFSNTGGSTTASSNSAGLVQYIYSQIASPISSTSTGAVSVFYSNLDCSNLNTTALTANGTSGGSSHLCKILSGTASAISIGASVSYNVTGGIVSSSNTNAITGSGSISYSGINFFNSSVINTTTVSRLVIDGGEYKGRNVNSAPSAGMIGEHIRSAVAAGSPVALTNNTAANVTSISLTPGIWDISSIAAYRTPGGSVTGTRFISSISPTSATLTGVIGDSETDTPTMPTANADCTVTIPAIRQSLSATTTYYLVAFGSFSAGTLSAYGRISATRVA
jgi:hypothetical protein